MYKKDLYGLIKRKISIWDIFSVTDSGLMFWQAANLCFLQDLLLLHMSERCFKIIGEEKNNLAFSHSSNPH